MANCGLSDCRSAVSDKSQGDTPFKGTCGLPDCRNSQASSSTGRPGSSSRPREEDCGVPGCMDPIAAGEGQEVCLYRGRDNSVLGRLADSYQIFWSIWKKVQTDPYYWSLFKAGGYFLLGLKLFRDLAAEFTPIPKCARKS